MLANSTCLWHNQKFLDNSSLEISSGTWGAKWDGISYVFDSLYNPPAELCDLYLTSGCILDWNQIQSQHQACKGEDVSPK